MTETLSAANVDFTNCDREPIHIPGAILPHGAMLVLDPETMVVMQAAGDTVGLLGVPIEAILGLPAAELFQADQVATLRVLSAAADIAKPRHLLDPILRVLPDHPLDASLHRSGQSLVLEFEAADLTDRFAADPLAGVQDMVRGFDDAASLHALCQLAAERVRDVTGYDRVLVYEFMQDESGWVIAESRDERFEPFLDLHYPAADIPQQARALYLKNWLRLITQVDYEPAKLIPTDNPLDGRPLDMSQAILRDVSPVHRQYLRNMGIDASMSISIICRGRLWGLIACHNYSPRLLPRHLRAICELFGSMFSLQLEARENAGRFEARLSSRMVLQNLMLNLAAADDYAAGLTRQSPNLLDYIHGGDGPPGGLKQGGVAVSVKDQLTFLGLTPSQAQIEALVDWLNVVMPDTDGVFSTDRLSELYPAGGAFANVASGILVISVSPEPSDFIIWFRPELVGSTRWAGEPGKLTVAGRSGDQLGPRKSFEVWKELVRGRCLPWSAGDRDAAFDLRVSLLHVVLRRINAAARERQKAAEKDRLLMAELDHRVKNTIANIQALVVQTSRSSESLIGFVEGLEGRIQSMAKAHSLLAKSRWDGVSIDSLLREELNPYAGGVCALDVGGPDVLLTPKSALSLSLAVHELATNAAKYGAIGHAGAKVAIHWQATDGGGIALTWTESGGPAVGLPTRRGFGSTLIERALAMETGGTATIHYRPGGVACDVFLPPSSICPTQEDASAFTRGDPVMIEAPAHSGREDLRILVVEDSFLLVMGLEAVFDDLGWTIVGPAARKDQAMSLVETETFDAALVDVNLDGEFSWEVAARLKQRGIPFVFSTGYDVTSLLPAGLKGSAVMAKPYRAEELEKCLRRVIDEARRAA